jgi:N4-gp56 family major capsid protein
MAYTVSNYTSMGGSLYGDLSVEDALTIQSKMLPIAKKNLTFGRFAQKDSKGQNEGNVIRHRRYKKFAVNTTPLGEGVTPDFDSLESEVISHTVRQYGRYTPVTDLMELLGQDPYVSIITERQAIQAAETMDLLAYKHFRAPSNVVYAGGVSARDSIVAALSDTGAEFDTVIRFLENNDAVKMTDMLSATPDVDTHPIRPGFIAICHPNLRQDLEAITGFVPVENYSDSGAIMDYEIGSYKGIRFIATTQATPFDQNGNEALGAGALHTGVSTQDYPNGLLQKGTYVEVYPIVIFAKDSVGTATIGGMDSIVPKVVRPTPSGTDPLGQRGTVGYTFFMGQVILNEDWLITVETGVRNLSASVTAGTGASWNVPPAPYGTNS